MMSHAAAACDLTCYSSLGSLAGSGPPAAGNSPEGAQRRRAAVGEEPTVEALAPATPSSTPPRRAAIAPSWTSQPRPPEAAAERGRRAAGVAPSWALPPASPRPAAGADRPLEVADAAGQPDEAAAGMRHSGSLGALVNELLGDQEPGGAAALAEQAAVAEVLRLGAPPSPEPSVHPPRRSRPPGRPARGPGGPARLANGGARL